MKNNKRLENEAPNISEIKIQDAQQEKRKNISQEFDNLEDLEILTPQVIKQERDLEKYPLAAMYYQYLIKRARLARENLIKNCSIIFEKLPEVKCEIPDIKAFERTLEKINTDYKGDFKKMLDVVRGSIIAPNLFTLRKAIVEFNKLYSISVTKNRIRVPFPSGYRDFTEIFYDTTAEFYGEIQFHLTPVFEFKKVEHDFYKEIRTIEGRARLEQREMTVAEKSRVETIQEDTKQKYDQAFQKTLNELI